MKGGKLRKLKKLKKLLTKKHCVTQEDTKK